MKKVLYISNIEVPYRVKFFNELAKKCELTVLYERMNSKNRNKEWAKSEKNDYKIIYLNGFNIKQENSFSLKIFKIILKKYDEIIFGCYNSPIQILAIFFMKFFKKNYSVNIDGETFITNKGLKNKMKKILLNGAEKYYVAGEKSAQNLKKVLNRTNNIYAYYFSSITEAENFERRKKYNREKGHILVIGQFYEYKGLDIAIEVAKKMPNKKFKFIGTGSRSSLLVQKIEEEQLSNIEVIPFLQKEALEKEYQICNALILPSRKECWGLVINEAASYGIPIVSTTGSGAAIEFLSEKYSMFLANPDSVEELYIRLESLLNYKDLEGYQEYLMNKSKEYTIEKSANIFANIINE